MQENISVDTPSGDSLRYQTRFCNPIARRENHMITIQGVSGKLDSSPFSVSRAADNRLGTLGMDALAKSKKDGYTLGYTDSAAMVYSRISLPGPLPYDPDKDFDHLGLHAFYPIAVAVRADSPWKTFGELVEVRLLLVSQKVPSLPKIPTITELGYNRSLLTGWFGMSGPAGKRVSVSIRS
jgi:tripartite-type tricarboxylate transporter receptor subunit TctC